MRAVWVLFFFLSVLSPVVSLAQSSSSKEEAAKVFTEAEVRFRKGDYQGALSGYQEAYNLSKEPLLLFNIGQCHSNLKQYQEAIDAYQRFLTESPQSTQRPLAESLIKENQEKLNKLPKTEPTSATQPNPETPSAPSSLPSSKLFYLGGASAGTLGLVLGTVSFGAALRARGIQKDPDGDNTEIEAPFQRAKALSHVADIFFVLGIASGGVGYWLDLKAKEDKISASLSPTGVSVQLQF